MSGPPLARYPPEIVRDGKRHFYRTPDGHLLPSIQAILSATQPARDRICIARWRQRVGQEQANRISRESSQRGRELHERIARYLTGQPLMPCPEALKPWRDSIKPVLQMVQEALLVEGAVFHTEVGYAGTLDTVVRYRDLGMVLIDWKSANSPRQAEWLTNYTLQVAALWGAIESTYALQLERALLAIALPDREAQLVWLDEDALTTGWQSWLKRVEQWHQQQLN